MTGDAYVVWLRFKVSPLSARTRARTRVVPDLTREPQKQPRGCTHAVPGHTSQASHSSSHTASTHVADCRTLTRPALGPPFWHLWAPGIPVAHRYKERSGFHSISSSSSSHLSLQQNAFDPTSCPSSAHAPARPSPSTLANRRHRHPSITVRHFLRHSTIDFDL